MAIESEVLRAGGKKREKKLGRLKSLEGHIAVLATKKAAKAALIADVAEFDAIVADIVSEAKRDEINASALVVAIRAIYAQDIINENLGVVGQRGSINKLNGEVQADADHTVTEKAEYQAATDNEV